MTTNSNRLQQRSQPIKTASLSEPSRNTLIAPAHLWIQAKKPKPTKRTVSLGETAGTLNAGQHKTLSIKLNRAGQNLLKTRHRLPTKLTVLSGKTSISNQTLTFIAPKIKLKKKTD